MTAFYSSVVGGDDEDGVIVYAGVLGCLYYASHLDVDACHDIVVGRRVVAYGVSHMVYLVEAYGEEHGLFLLYVFLRHAAELRGILLIIPRNIHITDCSRVHKELYSVPFGYAAGFCLRTLLAQDGIDGGIYAAAVGAERRYFRHARVPVGVAVHLRRRTVEHRSPIYCRLRLEHTTLAQSVASVLHGTLYVGDIVRLWHAVCAPSVETYKYHMPCAGFAGG